MSYFQTLGCIATLLAALWFLTKILAYLVSVVRDLYYFTVATPRFRRRLDIGQRARLLHSDVPVSISSVGDECAMILIPTPQGHVSQSVRIADLYPL